VSKPRKPFDGINYGPTLQPNPSGEGGTFVPGVDDLPNTPDDGPEAGFQGASKQTLGDYLNELTKDPSVGNAYKVPFGHTEAVSHHGVEIDTAAEITDCLFSPLTAAAAETYRGTPALALAHHNGAPAEGQETTFIDSLLKAAQDPDGNAYAGTFESTHFESIGEGDYKGSKDVDAMSPAWKRSHGPGHTMYASIGSTPGDVRVGVPGSAQQDTTSPPETPIGKRVSAILANNRFHPSAESPFIKDNNWGRGTKGTMGSQQTVLGKYDEAAPNIDTEELMKLGRVLMHMATGHGQGVVAIGEGPMDPESTPGGIGDVSVLPSLNQMGLQLGDMKIDADWFQNIRHVADKLGITGIKGGAGVEFAGSDYLNADAKLGKNPFGFGSNEDGNNNRTYANLTSDAEPFAGAMPWGMLVNSLVVLLALLIVATAFAALITLAQVAENPLGHLPEQKDLNNPARMHKGRNVFPSVGGLFLDMFNIPQTNYNFFLCIERGLAGFFGFSKKMSDMTPNDGVEAGLDLFRSAGYYANIMRVITRDMDDVEYAAYDFNTSGVFPAIGSVFDILFSITNGQTWRFIMMAARLGDNILTGEFYTFSPVGQDTDDISTNPATRIAKSRERRGDATLAWRSNSLPSRFLLPSQFIAAGFQFGLTSGMGHEAVDGRGRFVYTEAPADGVAASSAGDDRSSFKGTVMQPGNKRLHRDYVKFIEDKLEMEYVPFYFQDLRTNEFLAFHAFIESITDDYTPDYVTMEGYGRTDPVRIWKKTERAINLTFFVAATSPEDFDDMWFQINKLITLIYPQYSGGTPVAAGEGNKYKFVQPFSQIPTSSPLIRLRIGDLIKSNYSRFNLARIFGLGQPKDVFDLSQSESAMKTADEFKDKVEAVGKASEEQKDLLSYVKGGTLPDKDGNETVSPANPPGSIDEAKEIALLAEGVVAYVMENKAGYIKTGTEDKKKEDATDGDFVKVKKKTRCEIKEWTIPGVEGLALAMGLANGSPSAKVIIYTDDKPDPSKEVWASWHQLRHHPDTLKAAYSAGATLEEDPAKPKNLTTMQDPKHFFSPGTDGKGGNAIVRSFESTAGRGLAGHITSLSMGYDQAPWETERIGSRAPMWVKITCGFAPVHDIPPGIDADGFNRAPVYNVGQINNGLGGWDIHDGNPMGGQADDLQTKHTRLNEALTDKGDGAEDNQGSFF